MFKSLRNHFSPQESLVFSFFFIASVPSCCKHPEKLALAICNNQVNQGMLDIKHQFRGQVYQTSKTSREMEGSRVTPQESRGSMGLSPPSGQCWLCHHQQRRGSNSSSWVPERLMEQPPFINQSLSQLLS